MGPADVVWGVCLAKAPEPTKEIKLAWRQQAAPVCKGGCYRYSTGSFRRLTTQSVPLPVAGTEGLLPFPWMCVEQVGKTRSFTLASFLPPSFSPHGELWIATSDKKRKHNLIYEESLFGRT